MDLISRQAAIEAIHGAIFDFFDICDDDEESPMTYKDEQLLEINKAISGRVKQLPSAQQERKKGKWIEGKCDQCGEHAPFWPMASTYYRSNFCPNCGSFNGGEDE